MRNQNEDFSEVAKRLGMGDNLDDTEQTLAGLSATFGNAEWMSAYGLILSFVEACNKGANPRESKEGVLSQIRQSGMINEDIVDGLEKSLENICKAMERRNQD